MPLRTNWHDAFFEALQMELEAYLDALEFHSEFQLTSEPLRIDCVVIKKAKNIVIEKNIASIFKEWNLIEYKSPGDYVSVDDFYKVYGYACLYASFERVPITGLIISFVERHYPKKLLDYLQRIRGYSIVETYPGIYTVSGDIMPIQVIDGRLLSADENLWLKSLSDGLNRMEVERISDEIARQGKAARLAAYLYVIAKANPKSIQEAIEMAKTLTIEQVFENVGWTAKWEARGRAEGEARGETRGIKQGTEQGKETIARNLLKMGMPITEIAQATELPVEKVIQISSE